MTYSDQPPIPDGFKIMPITGWVCPRCGRVYNPLKEDNCVICNKRIEHAERQKEPVKE